MRGEPLLSAWELGSGGGGWNLFFWVDRVVLFAFAMLLIPGPIFAALRRGAGSRNLYRARRATILAMDVDALRCRVGVD